MSKKRASVACEPCIRAASRHLGIGRGHVPARPAVCAFPSPEPAQRTGRARLLEHLRINIDGLHYCANALLVPCRGSFLEMRTTSGSTLLVAARQSRSIRVGAARPRVTVADMPITPRTGSMSEIGMFRQLRRLLASWRLGLLPVCWQSRSLSVVARIEMSSTARLLLVAHC
jgi:hypothetical protein